MLYCGFAECEITPWKGTEIPGYFNARICEGAVDTLYAKAVVFEYNGEKCALVVCATVISHPREDLLICDAGAKCLGLDQGAHGNSALQGHGSVVGHPELLVTSLSEEVGKIHISGETSVKIGDRIMIIPNHSCSTANLTDHYILTDEAGNVIGMIPVDIRGNRTTKGM